jgi:hypothetical protein
MPVSSIAPAAKEHNGPIESEIESRSGLVSGLAVTEEE